MPRGRRAKGKGKGSNQADGRQLAFKGKGRESLQGGVPQMAFKGKGRSAPPADPRLPLFFDNEGPNDDFFAALGGQMAARYGDVDLALQSVYAGHGFGPARAVAFERPPDVATLTSELSGLVTELTQEFEMQEETMSRHSLGALQRSLLETNAALAALAVDVANRIMVKDAQGQTAAQGQAAASEAAPSQTQSSQPRAAAPPFEPRAQEKAKHSTPANPRDVCEHMTLQRFTVDDRGSRTTTVEFSFGPNQVPLIVTVFGQERRTRRPHRMVIASNGRTIADVLGHLELGDRYFDVPRDQIPSGSVVRQMLSDAGISTALVTGDGRVALTDVLYLIALEIEKVLKANDTPPSNYEHMYYPAYSLQHTIHFYSPMPIIQLFEIVGRKR